MVNIKLYLRNYCESEDSIVWVRFYLKREKVNFSTFVSVKPKDWNERCARVKQSDEKAADKNLIIEHIMSRINDVLVKYRLKDKIPTKDMFMRSYNRPSDYTTFHQYVEDKMRNPSIRIELSTLFTHRVVMKKLKEWSPKLFFDDITCEMLDEYYSYLRKDLENNANTAYKNMAILKKYIRQAFRDGYIDEDPFSNWKIRRVQAKYEYLTEDELNKLVELYVTGKLTETKHKTLEIFLFLCFTSLHIGDAKNLFLEQFSETSFTYYRIKLRNRKPEPIIVPLNEPAKTLLRNMVGTRKSGHLLTKIPSEATMNHLLKDISAEAEIGKALSLKAGRHTFATLFLKNTKDLAALKEILGHSSIQDTLIYAHILDDAKQAGIQSFNKFTI